MKDTNKLNTDGKNKPSDFLCPTGSAPKLKRKSNLSATGRAEFITGAK